MENNDNKTLHDVYSPNMEYNANEVYEPLVAESYAQNGEEPATGQAYVFDFSRYMSRCFRRIWVLILMIIVFAVCGALYGNITYNPRYTAKSTFVVNVFRKVVVTNSNGESVIKVSSDTTTANSVLDNLQVLILSDRIIEKAIASNPDINADIEDVRSMLSISNVAGTNIMAFSATAGNPQLAYDVVKAISNVAPVALRDIVSNGELTLIDDATVPSLPTTSNNVRSYATVGTISAIVIYFAAIFMLDFTSSTIKDAKDAENSVGKRLLGVIPDNHKFRKKIGSGQETGRLISDNSSGFSYIEAFKAMRIKFENLCARHKYKTVLVTSTDEHEGKTTITVNLAISLANKKHKVLLVECDLRRPNLFYMLKLSDLEYSILDVIDGAVPYGEAISYIPEYGVYGLFSRRGVNDATERLGSDAMRDLVLSLEADPNFDFVIFDAPPSLMMTDAEILTRYIDGVIMVIKEDTAQLHDIKNTVEKLSNERAVVLGTVLNYARKTEKKSVKRT